MLAVAPPLVESVILLPAFFHAVARSGLSPQEPEISAACQNVGVLCSPTPVLHSHMMRRSILPSNSANSLHVSLPVDRDHVDTPRPASGWFKHPRLNRLGNHEEPPGLRSKPDPPSFDLNALIPEFLDKTQRAGEEQGDR